MRFFLCASTNGANKFSKTLIFILAVGRQQVAFGHSSYGERVVFDPPHGRFLRDTKLFAARDWLVDSSLCFSRLPRGDLARQMKPRMAIVDEAAIVFVAAIRTSYVAAEARCRGRNKLEGLNLDAGGRSVGFALTGAGKVLYFGSVCLNARPDTQHKESHLP